jgi:triacylglycerol lipase
MKPNPILLVHGIDDSGNRFAQLYALLVQKGFGPVSAMNIIPPNGSIPMEVMAEQVAEAVEKLRHNNANIQVDIVAYSMGSLVTRYYLQRMGGKSLVHRFISIAGPHHGTLTAYLRDNAGCRQMRPGSTFLKNLNEDGDPWGGMEVFSFWTPLDLMIFPAVTSRLPRANNRRFCVLAHPLTVSDPRLMDAVIKALT